MKKFFNGFKNFIARGNLMDLAIGVMVGGAFNSIVKSFVDDILTPFVGVFLGKASVGAWKVEFELPLVSEGLPPDKVIISYGKFIQASLDFLILAFVIYALYRVVNSIRIKAEDPADKSVPTPKDIELLTNISSTLKSIQDSISEERTKK